MLEISDEGKGSAAFHMTRDRQMLSCGNKNPRLSFYQWNSFCVTYGLFAHPENFLRMDFCAEQKIEVIQRPTGGGIFFHEFDCPFSLFIPVNHVYREGSFEVTWAKIQKSLRDLLQTFFQEMPDIQSSSHAIKGRFCQTQAHECDFVWKKRKFGGAAFRKSKQGILCQASLFCSPFSWEKEALCVKQSNILEPMKQILQPLKPCDKEHLQKVITKAIEENI